MTNLAVKNNNSGEENPQCEADFLAQQRRSSKYNSFSKAAMYIGGLMTSGILGAALTSMLSAHAGVTAIAALTAFVTAPAAAAVLAVGVAIIAAGIATDYKSSTIYQKVNYKTSMFNAKKTADFLVDDLKQNNMCLTNEKDSPCAQKQWAANITPRGQQENWSASIDAQRQQAEATATASVGTGRA